MASHPSDSLVPDTAAAPSAQCPVAHEGLPGQPGPPYFSRDLDCWVVEGYDDALAVMRSEALVVPHLPLTNGLGTAEDRQALIPMWEQAGYVPLYTTGDVHRRIRRELRPPFTAAAAEARRPMIRQAADELVAGCAPAGHLEVMADIGRPLARHVMHEAIGVPAGLRRDFEGWMEAAIKAGTFGTPHWTPSVPGDAAAAVDAVNGFVHDMLDRPEDILPGSMLSHAAARLGRPAALSEAEIAANVRALWTAGYHTTVYPLASAVYFLFRDAEMLAAARASRTALVQVVRETFRYACPAAETIIRRATRDVVIGGQRIGRGQFVRTVLLRASRDPRRFDHPDVFDPERTGQGPALTFGVGPHVCLGNFMATAIIEEACAALADPRHQAQLAAPEPVFVRRPAVPVTIGPEAVHLDLRSDPGTPDGNLQTPALPA
jgi:cytochrome P450